MMITHFLTASCAPLYLNKSIYNMSTLKTTTRNKYIRLLDIEAALKESDPFTVLSFQILKKKSDPVLSVVLRGGVERVVPSEPDDAASEPSERQRTGAHSLQQPHPANAERGGSHTHSGHHR